MANRNVFPWIQRLRFRNGARRKKSDDVEQKGEDLPERPKTPNSPKNGKSPIDLDSPKRHIISAVNGESPRHIPKPVAQPDFDKVREQIKNDIRKELKITEGARNIGKLTSKKKYLANVNNFLKTSQKKLDELYNKLQERNAHIVVPGTEEISAAPKGDTSSQADNAKLTALQKQLDIELKVKHGAEIMVKAYSDGRSKNVKHLAAAQKILQDSEKKIDSLRKLILEEKSIIKEETSLPVPETDIKTSAPSLLVTDTQEPESAGDILTCDMKPIIQPDVELDLEVPPAPSQSFLHSDPSRFSFHMEIPDIPDKDSGDIHERSINNRYIMTPDVMSQPNCSSLDNSVPKHSVDLPHDQLPALWIQDQLLLKLQDIQHCSVQSVKDSEDNHERSINNRYIMTPDVMSQPNCSSLDKSVPKHSMDLPHDHLPAMWIQDQLLLKLQDFQHRSVQSVKDSGGSYGRSSDSICIMTPDGMSEPNCSSLDNSVSEKSEDLPQEHLPAVCAQDSLPLRMQDFQLCSVLGKGQFGKVLLAEHKETTKVYALKFIKKVKLQLPHHFNNLLSEKRIFQTVSNRRHPFLVNLCGCFHTRDHACFVMEYAAGGDLLSCLDNNNGPFPEPRAVFYSACVVLGLQYLHEQNIIHRDLKVENIVLDEKGFAKITDYGLSVEGN
ncbi:serine/threonine-protein kinase N2-like [Pelobates fuscus]|uniref:serine/threonine-protein kinase N2-like n=1 Tax=Pelobates fuscus TaxID=191477 RepID=UPI002FE4D0AE